MGEKHLFTYNFYVTIYEEAHQIILGYVKAIAGNPKVSKFLDGINFVTMDVDNAKVTEDYQISSSYALATDYPNHFFLKKKVNKF